MKPKMLFLVLFLFFRIGVSEVNAQHLTIRLHDGTESTDLLSTIQKLSFSDGNLILDYRSGSNQTFGLATIQKLYFDTQTSIAEYSSDRSSSLSVFPNPVEDFITVQNLPGIATPVFIYSSDGRLLLREEISSGKGTFDISNFHSGLYLLVANGQTVKFIKL
jgi:hypothetical protein